MEALLFEVEVKLVFIPSLSRIEKRLQILTQRPERLRDILDEGGFRKVLFNDPCCYCGGKSDSLEHVIPIKHGGMDTDNRVGACRSCNNSRNAEPFLVWMIKVRENLNEGNKNKAS